MTQPIVSFTQEEAIAFSSALDAATRRAIEAAHTIMRKRGLTYEEKHPLLKSIDDELQHICALNDRIKRSY